MKILLLGPHPPHGGGSAFSSQELACGLRRLGHDVVHIAPYQTATGLGQYPGLIWIPANFSWTTLSPSPEAQSEMDHHLLAAYIKYGPFDCVILGRELFLWQLPALRRVHHQPVVLICRGGYINRLASNESIEPEIREQLLNFYRGCDRIVCIARYLVAVVNRIVGTNQTVFLANPINLRPFNPTAAYQPRPGEPIRLMMVARITSRKRPWDAVEIVRILVDQNVDVHLSVCGDGFDMAEMMNRISHYGLENHILLKGRIDRQQVLDCLNQVETVLLCSDSEGRPRALQEAIAAGRGVVAYDNSGSHEVINEWLTRPWSLGRLVPIGDTIAASQAILDLAEHIRSNPEPTLPPQLPNPIEVLYKYESLLKGLGSQHWGLTTEENSLYQSATPTPSPLFSTPNS